MLKYLGVVWLFGLLVRLHIFLGAMNLQTFLKGNRRKTSKLPAPVLSPLPFGDDISIAQIGALRTLPNVPWYPPDSWHGLLTLRPRIIAGPRQALRQLCHHVDVWNLDYGFVDTALYCLTNLGERPLTGGLRDEFWDVVGLPLFELFVGGDGQVLARECEAHEGWHVNENAAEFCKLAGEPHLVVTRKGHSGQRFEPMGAGFAGDITNELCACGLETPRLINLPTEEIWQEEEDEWLCATATY